MDKELIGVSETGNPMLKIVNDDGYTISKWRYRELQNLCRQYDEMLHRIHDMYDITAVNYSSVNVVSSSDGNEMSKKIERNEREIETVRMIDLAIAEATSVEPAFAPFLKIHVTQGIPYEHMNFPGGKNSLTKYKRKFYYLLDKKKK